MRTANKLFEAQKRNSSVLCIGLDPDLDRLPKFNQDPYGILKFNQEIIEATKDIVCGYKLNFAFYEQYGIIGYEILKKTFESIPNNLVSIADAKRGDIPNTSIAYAKSIFDYFKADSATVNPLFGKDSILPWLNNYPKKLIFLLAITSNKGSEDFQNAIYRKVVKKSLQWKYQYQIGYVVGGTQPKYIEEIRKFVPWRYLLIPGVGTQGGNINAIADANKHGPVIINVSRDIIYTSEDDNFADKAREKAIEYNKKLSIFCT